MSKPEPGWKFEWRDDQIDVLKAVLDFMVDELNDALRRKSGDRFDQVAKVVFKQRVVEIYNEIQDVTG